MAEKEYIPRDGVLAEYDRQHQGPPGGARKIIAEYPAADVVEVVRCKDCKHRIVNEHYGKKGYMRLKAMCTLDTGDPFALGRDAEDDNWFCTDGEKREEGT